jgi:hypothetical protein
MARKYKYTDFKTKRVIFETVQPNYVSDEDVDKMVLEKTGRDPRLERALIEREIRMVKD